MSEYERILYVKHLDLIRTLKLCISYLIIILFALLAFYFIHVQSGFRKHQHNRQYMELARQEQVATPPTPTYVAVQRQGF